MSTHKQNSQKQGLGSLLLDSVKFGAICIMIMIIIMLVTSFAITDITKHEKFYPLIATIFQCIPAFFSSRMLGRKISHSVVLLGILQSVTVIGIYLLLALTFVGVNVDFNSTLKSLPYVFSSGIVGSITSMQTVKKHKLS